MLYREAGVAPTSDAAVVVTATAAPRYVEEVKDSPVDDAALDRISTRYTGTFPLTEDYPEPALVVTGRPDSALGFADQWRRYHRLPRATHIVLDRGGHGLTIELSGLVTTLLHDWLDRIEQRPPAQL